MHKNIDVPIRYIKGVGPKRAESFERIGIKTIEDLFYYFPRRYEDRRNLTVISQLQEGAFSVVKAQVYASGQRRSFRRRGFSIVEAVVGDSTGKISCVWFNQPYLKNYLKTGTNLILSGKVERYGSRLQLSSPEFEVVSGEQDQSLDVDRLIPIYTLPGGMTQRHFRHFIKDMLDEYLPVIKDFLSYDIRQKDNLPNLAKSLHDIHFPGDSELRMIAYERLSFDEFFLFQIPLALRKAKKKALSGISHNVDEDYIEKFIRALPFALTRSQEKVIAEIKADMKKPVPMQRLLQGDVGCGKTIVALVASLIAIRNCYQAAFMAPTEILAKQHYEKINSQLSASACAEVSRQRIKIGLLTSGANKKEKEKIYQEIKEGRINLIIGTHALLEGGIEFKNLGFVVIDEQHKFGVGQRALLPKKGPNPDVLIMTATPIPRTLAITLYGDLDISVIDELPEGRKPVKTLHFRPQEREKAYAVAKEELNSGRQVYIIYPVIEESYALDITGAKKMYVELKSGAFKDFRVGLIHGRLKEKEQDDIMLKFKNKELDVLVSTTVLEVGIDIPNATCMIVEDTQRFGLAQLHQLRGRVGRGRSQSFCLLISDAKTLESEARISAMIKYSDGFRIAEEDLRIRGPGEFFGQRQHGLTELKIANPLTQMQLLKKARDEAIRTVSIDPNLELRQNILLREKMLKKFPEYKRYGSVG